MVSGAATAQPQVLTPSQWASGLLFAIALLFAALPSGLSWETELSAEMMEGSWVVRLQWTSLFVWAWFMMKDIPLQTLLGHLKENSALLLVLAYCTASMLWSDFPGVVIKRFVQFVGVLSICLLVAFHHEKQFDRLLVVALVAGLALCGLSIVFAVAVPGIGIETAVGIEGTWRGILGQKNQLGIFSAASIYIAVFCFHRGVVHPVLGGSVLLTAAICLVMSRSSSSASLVGLSLTIYLLLRKDFIRSFAPVLRILLLLAGVVGVVYLGYFFVNASFPSKEDLLTPVAALFGKSPDLTGRGDIWELMWRSIHQHPYLGVGFSSFWLGPGGPSQFISDELKWSVPSAHSGYLEIINELGWVGMALFVALIAQHVVKLVKLFHWERDLAAFHWGLLVIFLVSNFSESTALRVLSYLQFVLLVSMIMVSAALQRIRSGAKGVA